MQVLLFCAPWPSGVCLVVCLDWMLWSSHQFFFAVVPSPLMYLSCSICCLCNLACTSSTYLNNPTPNVTFPNTPSLRALPSGCFSQEALIDPLASHNSKSTELLFYALLFWVIHILLVLLPIQNFSVLTAHWNYLRNLKTILIPALYP